MKYFVKVVHTVELKYEFEIESALPEDELREAVEDDPFEFIPCDIEPDDQGLSVNVVVHRRNKK